MIFRNDKYTQFMLVINNLLELLVIYRNYQ